MKAVHMTPLLLHTNSIVPLVQDDLAEHSVASPPRIDIDTSYESYDPFDYWEDIETCTDGYVDILGPKSATAAPSLGVTNKRKRSCIEEQARKRIKAEGLGFDLPVICEIPPVTWRSSKEKQWGVNVPKKVIEHNFGEPVTIFKDWRERFKDDSGLVTASLGQADGSVSEGSDINSDDDGSQSEHRHQKPERSASNALNIDALKAVITANLASLNGLPAGLDESTLLEYAMQMMTDGGKAEDLLGQLTDELFKDADDSNVEDIQEWVSKRKGATKPETVGSSDEAMVSEPGQRVGSPRQSESNDNLEKPTGSFLTEKVSAANRARKRKTTDTECGASLKPQAKRREMAHTRKNAKVLW